MNRWIGFVLLLVAVPLLAGADPAKKAKLQKGATIYAFNPVSWNIAPDDRDLLPADTLECVGTDCRYVVPACEALYVTSQIKDRTWVLPGDEHVRHLFSIRENTGFLTKGVGQQQSFLNISVSGGWSTEAGFQQKWFLSREECLARIGKPTAEPPATKPAEPEPAEKPPGR